MHIIFEDSFKNVDLYSNTIEMIKKGCINDTNGFMYKAKLPVFLSIDSTNKTLELADPTQAGIDTLTFDKLVELTNTNEVVIVGSVLGTDEQYNINATFISERLQYLTLKDRKLVDINTGVEVSNKNIIVLYSSYKVQNSNTYHVLLNNNAIRMVTVMSQIDIDGYSFDYLSGSDESLLTTMYPLTINNALAIVGDTIVAKKGSEIVIDVKSLPKGITSGAITELGTEQIVSNFDITSLDGKFSFIPMVDGFFTIEFSVIPYKSIPFFGYKFLIKAL
jgi:hypothetical protein